MIMMFNQILRTISLRNMRRPVKRICMLMSGLTRINKVNRIRFNRNRQNMRSFETLLAGKLHAARHARDAVTAEVRLECAFQMLIPDYSVLLPGYLRQDYSVFRICVL